VGAIPACKIRAVAVEYVRHEMQPNLIRSGELTLSLFGALWRALAAGIKANSFRWLLLCAVLGAILLVPASKLSAQTIYWLSDSRYVSVSGYAQTPPDPASNYSSNGVPSAPFANFQATVSGAADVTSTSADDHGWHGHTAVDSYASQNSKVTSTGVHFNSTVFAVSGGYGPWEITQLCHAGADSWFQVTFRVDQSVEWNLFADRTGTPHGNISFGWNLTSAQDGSILGPSLYDSNGKRYYAGWLESGDIYTLQFALHAESEAPGLPFGSLSDVGIESTFAIVPEPSSGLLLGLALTTMIWLRRQRA
jgi:hypothetical protein